MAQRIGLAQPDPRDDRAEPAEDDGAYGRSRSASYGGDTGKAALAGMNKTDAIRRARRAVPPLTTIDCTHFQVSVPADPGRLEQGLVLVEAGSYLAAQHARSVAVCRLALSFMGLPHVRVPALAGGTVEHLMRKALEGAANGPFDEAALPFWQVRFAHGQEEGGG